MTTLTCTITKNGRSDEFGRALTIGQSYTGAFDFVRALYMAGYASVADASVFDDDEWPEGTAPGNVTAVVNASTGGIRTQVGGVDSTLAEEMVFAGSTIVALGDSWTARYRNLNGYSMGVSYLSWLKSLLTDVDVNIVDAGVTSNTTAQMLARFDTDVAPYKPSIVFIFGGLNDNATGVASATTIANIESLITKVKTIGAIPALVTIPLATSYAATTTNVGARNAVNAAMLAHSGVDCLVFDLNSMMQAPGMAAMPGANFSGALVSDNLHPSVTLAHKLGALMAPQIRKYFKRPKVGRIAQATGLNFLPNGDMYGNNATGTQGFTLNTGFTGTGPDRWSISRTGATIAAACSKETNANGITERFKVAMSAGGSTAEIVAIQNTMNLRLWSSSGPTTSGRVFYVPSTGYLYAPLVMNNLSATDNTATWPTEIGATFVDGATLQCIGRITKGGTLQYGAQFVLNSLTAGQVVPYLRLQMKNVATATVLDHYANLVDSTSGTFPTLTAGTELRLAETATVPATFDIENTGTGSGPQIIFYICVACNNSGQADFGVGESYLRFF